MENLIPLINKLQDMFNTTGANGLKEVELPQIVVIGIQVCYACICVCMLRMPGFDFIEKIHSKITLQFECQ